MCTLQNVTSSFKSSFQTTTILLLHTYRVLPIDLFTLSLPIIINNIIDNGIILFCAMSSGWHVVIDICQFNFKLLTQTDSYFYVLKNLWPFGAIYEWSACLPYVYYVYSVHLTSFVSFQK